MKFKVIRTSVWDEEEKPCELEKIYKEEFTTSYGNKCIRVVYRY